MRSIEDLHMPVKLQLRPDLFLLLSLLLVILLNPGLDHGGWRRLVLGALAFVPVILSTVRLSQIKIWIWPAVLLMLGVLVFAVASNIFANPLGISVCVLRTFCCGPFLLPQEVPFRQSVASLHCHQHLSFAGVHMGGALLCDGCSLPGFIPDGSRPNRPSE
jgi:hypothetical protein